MRSLATQVSESRTELENHGDQLTIEMSYSQDRWICMVNDRLIISWHVRRHKTEGHWESEANTCSKVLQTSMAGCTKKQTWDGKKRENECTKKKPKGGRRGAAKACPIGNTETAKEYGTREEQYVAMGEGRLQADEAVLLEGSTGRSCTTKACKECCLTEKWQGGFVRQHTTWKQPTPGAL